MPVFSWMMFSAVQWASRRGLRDELADSLDQKKTEARQAGIRGETYAYWYLRRHGYVFIARNYVPVGAKGEIDLIGYDGPMLAFVEVRTRTIRERSEEHTSELQSRLHLVCRLLLEKKKNKKIHTP